jgi:D-alanyl-D-alanine carboxypeptidase
MLRRAALVVIAFIPVIIFGLVASPGARLDKPAPPSPLESQVDGIVSAAMKEQSVPGVSVAVARRGRMAVSKGYGLANVELDASASPATVYRIGSITKQFTAAAIMRLVDSGKITLDDPIEKFLPEFPVGDRRITVRHLLTHTSGIKSYTSLGPKFWDVSRLDYQHDQLLALFKDEPPDFQPGEKYLYNNSGYYLLGVILEKVAGEPYAAYMQKTMFGPLGLTSTLYCDIAPIIKHRASGYEVRGGQVVNASPLSMNAPFSAGALCSSVTDLVTWTDALMGGKVVSAASLAQMRTPATLNDGKPTTYGLGLGIVERDGQKVISHGGGINGFTSFLTYAPENGTTIAVLTNSGGAKPGEIVNQILKAARSTGTEF